APLADTGMNAAPRVRPVFQFAGLEFTDGRRDVPVRWNYRSGLRGRHESAGAEHLTESRHLPHHGLRRQGHIEFQPVFLLDLLNQVGPAGEVGPGRLRLGHVIALGEDDDPHRLTDPVRQRDATADRLVRLLGVDAELHVDFDSLVELGPLERLERLDRLAEWDDALLGDALLLVLQEIAEFLAPSWRDAGRFFLFFRGFPFGGRGGGPPFRGPGRLRLFPPPGRRRRGAPWAFWCPPLFFPLSLSF